MSHPQLLRQLGKLVADKIQSTEGVAPVGDSDIVTAVCGVPYGAIPLSTAVAMESAFPLALVRKEGAKQHGTGRCVEMSDHVSSVILVEDVVTSGTSILETADRIRQDTNASVSHAFCLLDRMQGGRENLAKHGIQLHHVLDLPMLMEALCDRLHAVDKDTKQSVLDYLAVTRPSAPVTPSESKSQELTYAQRVNLCKSAVGRRLLNLMEEKRSNLALAADVNTKAQLLSIADAVGPHIVILKTHADILDDWSPDVSRELQQLAQKHKFLIFEDRKYADIGAVAKAQYTRGPFRIAEWSDITNCHLVSGKTIIQGLKEDVNVKERALLLLAQMSTVDAQTNEQTKNVALEAAKEHRDFVCGFICQERLDASDFSFLYMTPGVNMTEESGESSAAMAKDDNRRLGQQYNDPHKVIYHKKSDIIIVGSGIYKKRTTDEQIAAAKKFQQAGWEAYLKRVGRE